MMVSGYSIELYCDCDACRDYRNQPHAYSTTVGFAEFGGENLKECIRSAKSEGWTFKERNSSHFAPGHQLRDAQ